VTGIQRGEAKKDGASPLPTVQFVSKSIGPPFRDGTKCFVRDLTNHLETVHPLVLGTSEDCSELQAERVPLYDGRGHFAPGLRDNMKAFLWLLTRSRANLWHFVFAPNPRSSQMARALGWLRRVPSIQTVASPPRTFESPARLLFGDRVVTQSRWTRDRFFDAYRALGQEPPPIEVIPPIAPAVPTPSPEAIARVRSALEVSPEDELLVYPGDLEMSQGADRVALLAKELTQRTTLKRTTVVFAYRNKTPRAALRARELSEALSGTGARFLPETPDIHALLRTATAILFPVDDLYGKVDMPIVLLEAIRLGTPIITSGEGPLGELTRAHHHPFEIPTWLETIGAILRGKDREPPPRDLGPHEPEAVARAYETLYEELLSPRKKGRAG
jgi:hypothetical protein